MAPKQSKSREGKRKVLLFPRQAREISSSLVTFKIKKKKSDFLIWDIT